MDNISVIIPTYNSSHTIGHCIDSIIGQTEKCKEIIVVDRFSTDVTVEIAKSKRAFVLQTNANRSEARNLGATKASSPGVLFVDSDMVLSHTNINECRTGLEEYDALVIPEVSTGRGFWAECKALDKRISMGNIMAEAPRCFRKEVFLTLGGYDVTLEAGEDWDLANRLKLRGLRIGRTESALTHDEGDLKLAGAVRKKYVYGKTFARYLRNNPQVGMMQVNPFSRILLPSVRAMQEDPTHGVGMFVMKSLEFWAAAIGELGQWTRQ